MFTKEQILEIQTKLASLGYRDSDFERLTEIDGNELVAVVKDSMNRLVSINDIRKGMSGGGSADTSKIEADIEALKALLYSASFTASFSGTRGAEGNVTLTPTLKAVNNTIPSSDYSVVFKDSRGVVQNATHRKTIDSSYETYTAVFSYNGLTINAPSVRAYAYYPIIYGFGSFSGGSLNITQRATIISSTSRRTYDITNTSGATAEFFILIPTSDVTKPTSDTSFTMGGAPVAMTKVQNYVVDGISYVLYHIGDYAQGVKLSIKVE